MTRCSHNDVTLVQQYVTRKGHTVRDLECEDCGRTFHEKDGTVLSNFPNTSYIGLRA